MTSEAKVWEASSTFYVPDRGDIIDINEPGRIVLIQSLEVIESRYLPYEFGVFDCGCTRELHANGRGLPRVKWEEQVLLRDL